MDVKFTTTTKAKLSQLTVTNGQVIGLSDSDEFYYDMGNSRHSVAGVWVGSTLPQSDTGAKVYIQVTADYRAILYIWDSTGNQFVQLTSGMVFEVINKAAYKQLPAAKKTANYTYFVTDADSVADLT